MNTCPNCGGKNIGPGPNYDNLRWIGCYDCGHGFTSTPRPKKAIGMTTEHEQRLRELIETYGRAEWLMGNAASDDDTGELQMEMENRLEAIVSFVREFNSSYDLLEELGELPPP